MRSPSPRVKRRELGFKNPRLSSRAYNRPAEHIDEYEILQSGGTYRQAR